MSRERKWKAGDLFFRPQWPTRIYRVHRVKGTALWYLGNEYGCNPPRGIIRESHAAEAVSWVKVEREYK